MCIKFRYIWATVFPFLFHSFLIQIILTVNQNILFCKAKKTICIKFRYIWVTVFPSLLLQVVAVFFLLFFYTWCFLCCCSPRLGKYYCSNLRSLSLSATCHLKLGFFSTFELSIIWLPKCLFCWFSHADFRKTYWQHLTSKGKGFEHSSYFEKTGSVIGF